MPRRRKPKEKLEIILTALPQLIGLVLVGIYFVPGFKKALGGLFVGVVAVLVIALLVLIGGLIWRRFRRSSEMPVATPTAPATAPQAAFQKPSTNRAIHSAISPAPSARRWTRELLSELEWKRFELVVAAYTRELGYDAVLTRVGADGGVDIEVREKGGSQRIMVVQCKAWDAYKVGVKPLRELYGVMAADKVANGAFFTTGDFTTEAIAFARDKHLDLVDGAEFLQRIQSLTTEQQSRLIDIATAGDYTTPTCPSCDVKMILRTAGKGTNLGNEFWGCPTYPRCRQTFKIPA
jgi:hypothetical protein